MLKFEGTFHDIWYDDTSVVLIRDKYPADKNLTNSHAVDINDLKAFIEKTQK
jgi:hypothetical protein